MKAFKYLLLSLAFVVSTFAANAQMEISDLASGDKKPLANFADSIRQQRVDEVNYFSLAQHRHERALIRKERNYLEISGGVQGSLTNLNEPWIETSGGDNSISVLATLFLKHVYTKNLFSLQTTASAKFGYYRMALESTLDSGETEQEHVWYKNQDEMQVEVTPSVKMSKNWSYGASVKFRSQFAKGYVSSASQEWYNLKSDFMAPGYLDLSGGLIYKCPSAKVPVVVTISPIAMSAIYVKSAEIRENAQFGYKDHTNAEKFTKPYGIDKNASSKYEGGISLQLNFDRKFGKNDFLRYSTTVFSFYGWMSQVTHKNIFRNEDDFDAAMEDWVANHEGYEPMLSLHPTVRWENKIEIKASKLLSTTLSYQMYYNRAQISDLQMQTLLSVGLAYTFTNK